MKKQGCSQRGAKAELALRLKEAVNKKMPLFANLEDEIMGNPWGRGGGVAVGVIWELECEDEDCR